MASFACGCSHRPGCSYRARFVYARTRLAFGASADFRKYSQGASHKFTASIHYISPWLLRLSILLPLRPLHMKARSLLRGRLKTIRPFLFGGSRGKRERGGAGALVATVLLCSVGCGSPFGRVVSLPAYGKRFCFFFWSFSECLHPAFVFVPILSAARMSAALDVACCLGGALLRRPFTHVDFVAKSHNFWRCQRRVFTPKKSIPIFRPTTLVFSSWGPTT